ncbi:Retrotransposon gag protein [Gossypium australe]|uniref:Retrotransposon gag protein n=1 Tax=Gossypium australe TaxID=47621 RepID=A0A5B6WTF9_9ROSI|nr:Retrotransposon gag protein [Gossypium australe]
MLRCCIIEFKVSWEKYLSLAEFSYINSYQSSIKMTPFEALYGCKCKTPLYWLELSEKKKVITDLIKKTEDKVWIIRDCFKVASGLIEFQIGEKVFLKVSAWNKVVWFGRKGKLSPRFLGPYEIIEKIGPVVYRLAFPQELKKIDDVFHVSMLRQYTNLTNTSVWHPMSHQINPKQIVAPNAINKLTPSVSSVKPK